MKFIFLSMLAFLSVSAGASAPANCTPEFVKTYDATKASLALFATGGSKASDDDTHKNCKELIALKVDSCTNEKSTLSGKDLMDECKSFQRRAKGKQ